MGKFVLNNIKERIECFAQERKTSVFARAIAGGKFTLEQQYKLFFWAMNGYLKGKPNKRERLVWNSVLVNVVDNESVCDDNGFVGVKLKKRCKLIGKEKRVSEVNRLWIEFELKPYFEDCLKDQVKNLSNALFKEIASGTITPKESKEAFNVYSKNTKKFMGGK